FEGRGQLRNMLRYLQGVEPAGGTGMANVTRSFVQRFSARSGIVVLLSDFLDGPGYEETLRLLHYYRFDSVAIRINDREEVEPSLTGDTELIDSESGERIVVQITPALTAAYKQRLLRHYAPLEQLCSVLRRTYLSVITDTPFDQLILEIFRR